MSRTKGAVGKKNEEEVKDEVVKEKKHRGRQPGQVIVREPAVVIELSKDYRIKMDTLQYTLQVKGKPQEPVDDDEENEAGYKVLGYYGFHNEGLRYLCLAIVNDLTIKKGRNASKSKEQIKWEEYVEFFNKSFKEVSKMFAPLDVTLNVKDSSPLKGSK